MQDIIKNKILLYFLVPAILAGWSIYNSMVLLPEKNKKYNQAVMYYQEAQPLIAQIIKLAPEKVVQASNKEESFDYDKAIAKTAKICNIPSSTITSNIRGKKRQKSQEVQDATISIGNTRITQFSTFLSLSLHLWPDLKCERLKLTKNKGLPDDWKAELTYRYFY